MGDTDTYRRSLASLITQIPGPERQIALKWLYLPMKSLRTRFEVIQETSRWTLVLCQIYTGRTHQIRVRLHSIGHPVLGDKVYGKASGEYDRQMLHAWRLGFFHPIAENWLEFEAGLPDDFLQSGVEENGIIRARPDLGKPK